MPIMQTMWAVFGVHSGWYGEDDIHELLSVHHTREGAQAKYERYAAGREGFNDAFVVAVEVEP